MLIINPGTQHFDFSDGSVILDINDYSGPGSSVDSLDNDPAAETSN